MNNKITGSIALTTSNPEYDRAFWNLMRGRGTDANALEAGTAFNGSYKLPEYDAGKFLEALEQESLFRSIGTTIYTKESGVLYASDFKDKAIWVPEGAEIPVSELMKDLERYGIESHKLATIVCLDEDFVRSTGYKLEKHLIDHMAKAFARAEEEAFILGEGAYEPTGILDDNGAETGVTTQALTYDSIIQLFFSVKSEYRKHGKWLMNDETALVLRTLKDADGNYLWNHANDTILGKEVLISEFMPSVEVYGSKPVAFGDFSHYEIIDRSRFSIRALNEMFIANQQIGYLGYAFLDGKLTNKEAVKVLSVSAQ